VIDQILVDLDDVLNHFTLHALRHCGCFIRGESEFPVEVGYDIVAAYNKLMGRQISAEHFWSLVTPAVWVDLLRRDDANWLLSLCEEYVGRENVIICTASLGDPQHYAGKMGWIYRNLPVWTHRQVSITSMKHAYARPGSLLIDDSGANVDKFHAKGGKTILVPRPWNRNNRYDSVLFVNDALEKHFRSTRTP
jgi:hypothetical protein